MNSRTFVPHTLATRPRGFKTRHLEHAGPLIVHTGAPAGLQPDTGPVPVSQAAQSADLDSGLHPRGHSAIAVEIELDALLRSLMKIALENAGAQRGVFLQERELVHRS